jgi:TRAP-type mannitol/chloroaromatic compound transport system substrate-binding protein
MRKLTLSVVALGMAFGLTMPAAAKVFKMTTFTTEGSSSWQLYPETFVKKVTLATDGKVKIKPYGAFVLASIFEANRAVLDGRADIAYHYPAFEINQNPASAFISDIPGGMGSDAKLAWLLAGGGVELWKNYRNSQGLHGLFCGLIGSELFANSHKKVQTLADFKGYRYRTAGANTFVMKKLGAAPNSVPGPEVFTMLERKGVDGAEYLDPFGNFALGFHKIAKYVIYPGIHAPGGAYEVLMKKSTWDAFPADIQQKIEMVCDSVLVRSYATLQFKNADAMRKMAESGRNELVKLSPEVIAAVQKAGREWAEEKIKEQDAKGKPWMGKLAKSFYSFMEMWTKNSGFQVVDRE